MKKWLLATSVLLFAIILNAQSIIQRKHVPMRSGAGSYYPIVSYLTNGTEYKTVNDGNSWVKIAAADTTGFVAKTLLTPPLKNNVSRMNMVFQKKDIRVAQMGITAGIKGFAGNYCKQFGGDENFLTTYNQFQLDPYRYKQFKWQTYKNVNIQKIHNNMSLPQNQPITEYTFSEQALGLGIASKIANIGIYKDKRLEEYVNSVGMLIVESSAFYQDPYTFFILDDESINAYSCPGGIVFVTLGMLKKINSEDELAFVLSHEIAHVGLKHGMQEAEKRKEHLLADDLFMELDDELKELGRYEENETEKEMEQLSVSIYNTIYSGRLHKYEQEADETALFLMRRAGYNPAYSNRLLRRLCFLPETSHNEHYTLPQIQERLLQLEDSIHILSICVDSDEYIHTDRYQREKPD